MICYMVKKPDGELYPRFISETRVPSSPDWSIVMVEIREYDEKRKRLEDAAPDLLEACKEALNLFGPVELLGPHQMMTIEESNAITSIKLAIAKAEGK